MMKDPLIFSEMEEAGSWRTPESPAGKVIQGATGLNDANDEKVT